MQDRCGLRILIDMAKTKAARRPRHRETCTVPPKTAPEFPGCKPVHLPRKDMEDFGIIECKTAAEFLDRV